MSDEHDKPPGGKIYDSGIQPEADRADYALPPGEPALQDAGPEYPGPESEPNPGRRKFLALGLGLGIATAAGGLVALDASFSNDGRSRKPSPRNPRRARPAWADHLVHGARQAAAGSIEDLVAAYPTFIMVVEAYGEQDQELWAGMARLAAYVDLDRSKKAYRLAKRMVSSFEINPPPQEYARMRLELEAFVQTWERRND